MINFERHQAGLLGLVRDLDTRGFSPSRVLRKMARAVITFGDRLHAAQTTAILAERYYSMSDASLARIGLTREEIPAALIRVLTR